MDFHTFKRRDLQTLCKLNNKPANTTNAAMADALASLPTVEGLEEILGKLDSEPQGSPERSVLTSPNAPGTTTRRKAVNKEIECSNLATRTRCRTRGKAVEGTDTKKTPATRTTRKRASQEAPIQKKMEEDLQAEFEADMEQQTEVAGGKIEEVSEEVSGISEETQSEAQSEVMNGQVIDAEDGEKNVEDKAVNEVQDEEASEILDESKVDFHSLNRKVLQNLCKKNKIPANMTNAAMADALEALEIVEGLQEFVQGCDSQAPMSPLVSGITSSCARQSRTTMRSTKEEPRSSKMVTKSCRGSRRRVIEDEGKTNVPETPTALVSSALSEIEEKEDSAVQKSESKEMENSSVEISEISGVAECNNDSINSLMQEAPVIESTVEDDNLKGNNGPSNVEDLKEPEELVSENVVEEEVKESFEVSELLVANCATQHEDLKIDTAGCELGSDEVQHSNNLKIDADGESKDCQLENFDTIDAKDQITEEFVSGFTTQADQLLDLEMIKDGELGNTIDKEVTVAPDSAAGMIPDEVEGDMLQKSDTESATAQADKLSVENNVGSGSETSYTEDVVFEKSDSEAFVEDDDQPRQENNVESESDGSSTEDEMSEESDSEGSYEPEDDMSEESDSEATAQDDQPSFKENVESESEDSSTEDEMCKESDSEPTTQHDQPSLAKNVESESEGSSTEDEMSEKCDTEATTQDDQPSLVDNVETLENLDTTTDSAAVVCWVGKSENFDTESTIQAIKYQPTENDLKQTSLRKLRQMVKEKIQEKTINKKMENLTLEETEAPLPRLEEVQECLLESESAVSMGMSGNDEAPSQASQMILKDKVIEDDSGESKEDTNDEIATLSTVDVLLDNEVIPAEEITGNIDVTKCPPQATTPSKWKPLLLTPSKSSSKTPKSAGRKSILDDNKENIDNSVTKTEPGKVKFAVTESLDILSPLSMAKLKKDFKQQSEKKKQALQRRSENRCPVASP